MQLVMRLLEPSERAPGLPPDTAGLPYEAHVRGVLLQPARVGEAARVRTRSGRELEGVLEVVEPADTHTFGRPHRAHVEMTERIGALAAELR